MHGSRFSRLLCGPTVCLGLFILHTKLTHVLFQARGFGIWVQLVGFGMGTNGAGICLWLAAWGGPGDTAAALGAGLETQQQHAGVLQNPC